MMSDGTAAANRKAAVAEPADEAGEKKPSASELCEEGSDDASEAGEAGDGGDRDSRSKQTVVTHNERWEDAFSRLRAFQRRHGHCEVPFRYAPDTRLGRWVAFQRTMYRRMREGKGDTVSLTQDRIRRLESIGFEWSVRGSKLSPWELRFNDLVNFRRRFRHCKVPEDWEENQELGIWVKAQRSEARKLRDGKNSRLTEEHISRLSNIGFVWEEEQHIAASRELANASVVSSRLQHQRTFASLQPQYSAPVNYLASSLPNHLLQAQLDSLFPLSGLSYAQHQTRSPSIPAMLASEAIAEASRREAFLRQEIARRNEPRNLYSGEFPSAASLGHVSSHSGLSALAQSTLLEQIVLQQALQDIRNLSSSVASNQQAISFASRSLHGELPFARPLPAQVNLFDTRTSTSFPHGPFQTALGPTSLAVAGPPPTFAPVAAVRGVESNEAQNRGEHKGP